MSIFSVAGRLGSGFFGDRVDKRHVIAVALLFQFIGTIVFAFSVELWHLAVFVVTWGFGFGASIPVRFALIADLFGRRHYGSIMGSLMTISAVFGVIAPVLVGWIFDIRGNYREPFALMAFTILIAIPMILTLGRARGDHAVKCNCVDWETLISSPVIAQSVPQKVSVVLPLQHSHRS